MSKPKKIDIFIIPIKDIDVRFTYSNSVLSYHFLYNDQNYGNAINIKPEDNVKPKLEDGIRGGGMLMLNAIESVEKVLSDNNK